MARTQSIGKYPQSVHCAAAACLHLSLLPAALLERGLLAWMVPLALWLVLRGWSPLVDHHGRHAVNWGVWLASISLLLMGLAWLRPGGAQGEWVVLLIVAACWSVICLRRAWRGWKGLGIGQSRFSWFS